MADAIRNNIVYFEATEGDTSVALAMTPEGSIVWEPGLRPNVWSFRTPYTELAKLGGDLSRTGRLSLCDTGEQAAVADVTIDGCRIVDCQPLDLSEVVNAEGVSSPMFAEYRLTIADWRDKFVAPRGGRLKVGLINPTKQETTDVDAEVEELTYGDMLRKCLGAMGLSGTPLPDDITTPQAPKDVKWFGNHAPTELQKLLDRAGYIFVPLRDGTARIVRAGQGNLPTFRDGDALPELRVPAIDRRSKTVVVSSYPARTLVTQELAGPAPDAWEFVIYEPPVGDVAGRWVSTDISKYGNLTSAIRNGFSGLEEADRQRVALQAFRVIRITRGGENDPPAELSPLLAQRVNKDGKLGTLSIRAVMAIKDPISGLWRNSESQVDVPISHLQGDDLVYLGQLTGRVRQNNVEDFLANFEELQVGGGTLAYSFEAARKVADKWEPEYFEVGYRREAGGGLVKLSAAELANALAGGDVVVVTDVTLQRRIFNGAEQDVAKLEQQAKDIAEQVVAQSGTIVRHLIGRGYQAVELSGLVNKVTWDPSKFWTDVEVANWWPPAGALDPGTYREQATAEAYPNQAATGTARQAMGAAGDRPPVIPIGPSATPPVALPSVFPVLVTVDGGVAGGGDPTPVNCTFTYKLFSILGVALKNAAGADIVGQIPAKSRIPLIEYVRPANLSLGLAYRDQEGAVKLYDVAMEVPVPGDCEGD